MFAGGALPDPSPPPTMSLRSTSARTGGPQATAQARSAQTDRKLRMTLDSMGTLPRKVTLTFSDVPLTRFGKGQQPDPLPLERKRPLTKGQLVSEGLWGRKLKCGVGEGQAGRRNAEAAAAPIGPACG